MSHVPTSWVQAATEVIENPDLACPEEEAWKELLGCIGWRIGQTLVPAARLSVSLATALQMEPAFEYVKGKHLDFVAEALSGGAGDESDLLDLQATFRRLWALRWENVWKEAFWRLALNGFTGFSAHEGGATCPCEIAMHGGDRLHHFWKCYLAQGLVDEMCACLGGEQGMPWTWPLRRFNLWLARPTEGVDQRVWDVVCLAATTAMEKGRRYLYATRENGNRLGVLNRGRVLVSAEFWGALHSFAALRPPRGWETIPADHPFLRVSDGRLYVQEPPGVLALIDDD